MVAASSSSFALRRARAHGLLACACLALAAGCGKEEGKEEGAGAGAAAEGGQAPAASPAPAAEARSPARSGRAAPKPVTTTGEEPYESSELGALHGTILFTGTPPERFPLGADKTPECKHHAEVDQRSNIVIVEDGKLANVYVALASGFDAAELPPVPEEAVTLEQKGCMYVPRVLALRAGQPLRVTNGDPTNHNVHTRAKRNGEINKNMGTGQPPLEFRFERAERPVPFACDIHPWMGAAVFVEEHPWFAVSDAQGAFRIRDVPPGEYVVEAVHEALGKVSGTVAVKAGVSTGFTLTIAK